MKMEPYSEIIKKFEESIREIPSLSFINSLFLSGSHVGDVIDSYSDLYILIICEDDHSKQIYTDINGNINDSDLISILDVKLIENVKSKQKREN